MVVNEPKVVETLVLPIDKITIDQGISPRELTNDDTVSQYYEALLSMNENAPVKVSSLL